MKVSLKTSQKIDLEVNNLICNIQKLLSSITNNWHARCNDECIIIIRDRTSKVTGKKTLATIPMLYVNTRTPQDRSTLNRITKELKNKINEIKNASVQHYLSRFTANEFTDYSFLENHQETKTASVNHSILILTPKSTWVWTITKRKWLPLLHILKMSYNLLLETLPPKMRSSYVFLNDWTFYYQKSQRW